MELTKIKINDRIKGVILGIVLGVFGWVILDLIVPIKGGTNFVILLIFLIICGIMGYMYGYDKLRSSTRNASKP